MRFGSCYVIETKGRRSFAVSKEYDERRDAFLERAGYRVLRFKNDDVLSDSDAVVNRILAVIEDIQKHRA